MKPNEYIKKYNLKGPDPKFNHSAFVNDLTLDFLSLVEFHQQTNWSYEKFKNCVKETRQKFDSISRKVPGGLPEKIWKYFFATKVVKVRDEMFGEELERRRQNYERRKQERREEREYWHRAEEANRSRVRDFFENMFGDLWEKLTGQIVVVPQDAYRALGIAPPASSDDVKKRYKELAFNVHPDRGGDPGKFRKLVEAKNRCLAYLAQQE